MQTEEEQKKIIQQKIEHNKKQWNSKDGNGKYANKQFWKKSLIEENRHNYNSLNYPFPDTKNPIDGGSKVEWAYWNTLLYPTEMHDKLTNKDYFIKKGIQEKYFPKRYIVGKYNADIVDVLNLYQKNHINSLIIKPVLGAESKGISKIDKINPFETPKEGSQWFRERKTIENFKEANQQIKSDINKTSNYMNETMKGFGIRTPFKGYMSGGLIYEENLNPNKNGLLDDYKFWCVNGEPIFCEVISGRADGEINVAFIDKNKQRLPLNHTQQRNMTAKQLKEVLNKCSNEAYTEMLDIAKKASKGLPLIRIDCCLNDKGEPKFIEAQDLYNYHMHRITMDDITREAEHNKCTGIYTPPFFKPNPTNVEIMAKKFKLAPNAFTEEKCKIYNNATGKIEQISSFEKMIGNLIDLTKIDEKDIGDYPCGDPEEAKKKEEEAKQYLRKMKALNNMVNAIKKGQKVKQAFNELKTQHGKCLENKNSNKSKAPLKALLKDKNKQQKEEKEKLKQIRKNIKHYISVDSKRVLQVPNPYVGGNRIKFKDTEYKNYSFLPNYECNFIGGKKPGVYNLNNKQPVKSK